MICTHCSSLMLVVNSSIINIVTLFYSVHQQNMNLYLSFVDLKIEMWAKLRLFHFWVGVRCLSMPLHILSFTYWASKIIKQTNGDYDLWSAWHITFHFRWQSSRLLRWAGGRKRGWDVLWSGEKGGSGEVRVVRNSWNERPACHLRPRRCQGLWYDRGPCLDLGP